MLCELCTVAYLGQLFELVGVEEKLLQTPTVAEDLIGDSLQVAMSLVHRLDVAVAAPQGDTLQHGRPPLGRAIGSPVLLKTPHRRVKVGGGERAHSMSKNKHSGCSHDDPEQEAEIHLRDNQKK